ncbi:hypothetical protein ACYU03_10205 [Pseudomonas sp. X10]
MMESSVEMLRIQMQSAGPVLMRLDEEMESIRFDPLVPSSVEAAIAKVYRVIDRLLGPFKANPVLGPLAEELRSQYLDGIHARVNEARHLG